MRNRAFLIVALLGLLTLALAPGYASAASQGQDLSEMLASTAAVHAVAVSGPIAQASPLSFNFGIVDAGSSSGAQGLQVSNVGGQDLHISAINSSDPAFIVTGGSGQTITPGNSLTFPVYFSPTDGNAHSGTLTIVSDATNGTVPVSVAGQGNVGPTIANPGNQSTPAFATLTFTVTATDNGDTVDDQISFTMTTGSPALPVGATFDGTNGHFSWTPGGADGGTYPVTFCASDGRLQDCTSITITVTVTNNPPVANAGGNYFGATNQLVHFNGSATDPDIAFQTLTPSWNFGDGFTANSFTPDHAYGAPGNYLATLNVCDNGSPQLCDNDVASVTIVNQITAQILLKAGATTLKASGGGQQIVGIEETQQPLTNIDLSSVRMSSDHTGAATIPASTKGATLGDLDGDGVQDLSVRFDRKDITTLFAAVPKNTVVQMIITGNVRVGASFIPFRGEKTVTITKSGGAAVSVAAYPNPFNPETAISATLRTSGPLTMKIYSIDGRLVRTLLEDEYTQAGTFEVRWNGIDNSGNHVSSGLYFVRTSVAGGETSVFKLAVTK